MQKHHDLPPIVVIKLCFIYTVGTSLMCKVVTVKYISILLKFNMFGPHLILLVIIPLYNSSFPQSLDSFIYSRTLSGKSFPVLHLHCLSTTCYLYKPGRFFWRPTYKELWVVGSFIEFSKSSYCHCLSLTSTAPPSSSSTCHSQWDWGQGYWSWSGWIL